MASNTFYTINKEKKNINKIKKYYLADSFLAFLNPVGCTTSPAAAKVDLLRNLAISNLQS
ncbi:hypothetical protein BpHYR1_040222 [Brachionus plicatilis]|uniref:Uncharacterized protein n=1 Tax=Brachionus plicatilis TaxID=10195 RepID=A0A3M7S200_BRAPC|nr:hypothetical protein BpHYR1_040222 [Brachionus plicatilis]